MTRPCRRLQDRGTRFPDSKRRSPCFQGEIFNFQNTDGSVYGYVQPSGRKGKWQSTKINIKRIGGTGGDASVSGMLAVWVATIPTGGAVVVGWYQNATIFRDWQPPPVGSGRQHAGVGCGYYVTADYKDAVLIAEHERTFPIPQHGAGNFGQSNIWYANDPIQQRQLRLDIFDYVQSRRIPTKECVSAIQPDPFLRQQVERAAVDVTVTHFTELGYFVRSVEKDNVGWDLEANFAKRHLRLEVKGLSGSQTVVELTPNEYSAMQSRRDSYRVCVVTNALTAPRLEVFAYSSDSGRWESDVGIVLNFEERVGARCSTSGKDRT